jgi:biopolymer transport protein TolQ
MAPGVAVTLVTTVAGMVVAIPSMFAYIWLLHSWRTTKLELDNFSLELISKMEIEFLPEN